MEFMYLIPFSEVLTISGIQIFLQKIRENIDSDCYENLDLKS